MSAGGSTARAESSGGYLVNGVTSESPTDGQNVILDTIEAFSSSGGGATFEPGTPDSETFTYSGVDASSNSLVGIDRTSPNAHQSGTFVEATSASPTPVETPSETATPQESPGPSETPGETPPPQPGSDTSATPATSPTTDPSATPSPEPSPSPSAEEPSYTYDSQTVPGPVGWEAVVQPTSATTSAVDVCPSFEDPAISQACQATVDLIDEIVDCAGPDLCEWLCPSFQDPEIDQLCRIVVDLIDGIVSCAGDNSCTEQCPDFADPRIDQACTIVLGLISEIGLPFAKASTLSPFYRVSLGSLSSTLDSDPAAGPIKCGGRAWADYNGVYNVETGVNSGTWGERIQALCIKGPLKDATEGDLVNINHIFGFIELDGPHGLYDFWSDSCDNCSRINSTSSYSCGYCNGWWIITSGETYTLKDRQGAWDSWPSNCNRTEPKVLVCRDQEAVYIDKPENVL